MTVVNTPRTLGQSYWLTNSRRNVNKVSFGSSVPAFPLTSDISAQEVAAILREKLVVAGGDLVTAQSRVRDLEMDLLDDKKSLKKSAQTLLESST